MAACRMQPCFSGADEDSDENQDENHRRYLPHHVLIYQILIKLPIKTLIRFKSVSKLWYSTLSSLEFANAHFNSSPFSESSSPSQCLFIKSGLRFYLFCYNDGDDDMNSYYGRQSFVELKIDFCEFFYDLTLVGSCRGLVCLQTSTGVFIVWNPNTSQFRRIPDFSQFNLLEFRYVSCGFGYASSVDDFKIVRIIEVQYSWEIMVYVFSFKSNNWRRIDLTPYNHLPSLVNNPYSRSIWNMFIQRVGAMARWGVLVDETLYWVVANGRTPGRRIVAFNLELESFDELAHVKLRSTELYRDNFLFSMGGCLCKCGSTSSNDTYVTIFRHPRGKKSVRLFKNMEMESWKDFVGFTKTGKFFVIDRSLRKVGLVDPGTSPVRYTPLLTIGSEDGTGMVSFVPSLISPNTTVELP